MKALSFSQPWLWVVELFAEDPDGKGIENRSWPPPLPVIGQRIALHAAKSWDERATSIIFRQLQDRPELMARMPGSRNSYAKGAITCTAKIDRVVTVTEKRTFLPQQQGWLLGGDFGEYGWVLKEVRMLSAPVECPGKQGLWNVPDDVATRVVASEVRRCPDEKFRRSCPRSNETMCPLREQHGINPDCGSRQGDRMKRNAIIAVRSGPGMSGGITAMRDVDAALLGRVFDAYANRPEYTRVQEVEIDGLGIITVIRDETMKDRITTEDERRRAGRLDDPQDEFFTMLRER